MQMSNIDIFIRKIKQNNIIRVIFFPFVNLIRGYRFVFYTFSHDSKKIRELKDSHVNEKCFIIGNGPSLTVKDLETIKGNFSFAANRIFEIFPNTSWRPDIYLSVDSNVIRDNIDMIKTMDLPCIFIQLEGKKYGIHKDNPNVTYVNNYYPFLVNRYKRVKVGFSDNPSHHFIAGETVLYNAIQLAVYMGFKEIYLLGVDHNYAKKIDAEGNLIYDASVKDYFGTLQSKDYTVQNVDTSTKAFEKAREECEKRNITIRNVTRGGKLEVFERKQLEDVV